MGTATRSACVSAGTAQPDVRRVGRRSPPMSLGRNGAGLGLMQPSVPVDQLDEFAAAPQNKPNLPRSSAPCACAWIDAGPDRAQSKQTMATTLLAKQALCASCGVRPSPVAASPLPNPAGCLRQTTPWSRGAPQCSRSGRSNPWSLRTATLEGAMLADVASRAAPDCPPASPRERQSRLLLLVAWQSQAQQAGFVNLETPPSPHHRHRFSPTMWGEAQQL